MIRKRRVEVTFETEVSVAVRGTTSDEACWCGGLLLPPAQAARAAAISVRAVYRLIEAGSVHFTDQGEPRVCSRSLPVQLE